MLFFTLRVLGGLFVVGDNANGNLGVNNNNSNVSNFTRIDIDPVQVAAGQTVTAILGKDGLVYTSGTNHLGSLCVPTSEVTKQNTFTRVPNLRPGEVVEMAATSTSLLLLLKNGSVLGCGPNTDGRLSYYNVLDEEEHVLSRVDVPDSVQIKSVIGLRGQNLLVA